jgi:predicted O-linked N-acetylglucosamine transferase (SPINDLY family)
MIKGENNHNYHEKMQNILKSIDTKMKEIINTTNYNTIVITGIDIIISILSIYKVFNQDSEGQHILDRHFIFIYQKIIDDPKIVYYHKYIEPLHTEIINNNIIDKKILFVLHNNSAVINQKNKNNILLEYNLYMKLYYNKNIEQYISLAEIHKSNYNFISAKHIIDNYINNNKINIYDFDFLEKNKYLLSLFWLKCYIENDLCNFNEIEKLKVTIIQLLKNNIIDGLVILFLKFIGINNSLLFKSVKNIMTHYKNSSNKDSLQTNKNYKRRVGYISSNFINHAQSNQFSHNFFSLHEAHNIEVYLYSLRGDITNNSYINNTPNCYYIEYMNTTDIIEIIKTNNLDIIVNCNGHSDSRRPYEILSHRVAPIQIDYLGYPGTSGSDFIDYYIGDKISTNNSNIFTEKLLLMDYTYQLTEHINHYIHLNNTGISANKCREILKKEFEKNKSELISQIINKESRNINIMISNIYFMNSTYISFFNKKLEYLNEKINKNELSNNDTTLVNDCIKNSDVINQLNNTKQYTSDYFELYMDKIIPKVPEDKFILGTVNNPQKIQKNDIDIWKKILLKNSNAILIITMYYSPEPIQNIKKYFGTEVEDQIYYVNNIDKNYHLMRLRCINCILDTTCYGAHTTAGDVIWSGTPIVTLCGENMESRVCSSMLNACSLNELITYSDDEYVNLVTKMINNHDYYSNIKNKVENSRTSKLFDREYYVNNICHLYEGVLSK